MNAVTTPGWHARLVLLAPGRVAEGLARLRAIGWGPVPNLWQVELAVLRMWERILFRSDTIGTCADDPPRRTLRARFLQFRPLRFFGLAWERAITPWDLSGFLSDEAQIVRHLLGLYHATPISRAWKQGIAAVGQMRGREAVVAFEKLAGAALQREAA